MTLRLFIVDSIKGAAIAAALGLPLLALVLWLMRSAGSFWWLWAWAVWVAFNLGVLVLYPSVIAPLFNRFEPLADGAVRQRVEALLARCGFASKGLFVMDGSRRSAHGNAYFTGLGRSKRIVFFDTLLARLDPDEIEAVLAHELGHFRHRHVLKRIVLMFAASLAGLWLLGWLSRQGWFYQGLGVTPRAGEFEAAALVLFFLALPVFTFLLQPLSSLGLAPARVPGRRVRGRARPRAGPGQRAGQALRRQRIDADARPAALGVLRLASARVAADRPTAAA